MLPVYSFLQISKSVRFTTPSQSASPLFFIEHGIGEGVGVFVDEGLIVLVGVGVFVFVGT